MQIAILTTGLISCLEYFESRDELVCRHFLQWKAIVLLHSIKANMGGSSSKQEIDGDNQTEEMVGNQSNLSLIDLRQWHYSSIRLVMEMLLLMVIMLLCAWKRYKQLYDEVSEHRACSGMELSIQPLQTGVIQPVGITKPRV